MSRTLYSIYMSLTLYVVFMSLAVFLIFSHTEHCTDLWLSLKSLNLWSGITFACWFRFRPLHGFEVGISLKDFYTGVPRCRVARHLGRKCDFPCMLMIFGDILCFFNSFFGISMIFILLFIALWKSSWFRTDAFGFRTGFRIDLTSQSVEYKIPKHLPNIQQYPLKSV